MLNKIINSKWSTIAYYLLSLITIIWLTSVLIMIDTNNTISNLNQEEAKSLLLSGGIATILFEQLSNLFVFLDNKKTRKLFFVLNIVFRTIALFAFITFILGAFMFTNGDGTFSSIF